MEDKAPPKCRRPGNQRGQHIAEYVVTDLGHHFVADENRAGPAGVRHKPVDRRPDTPHIGQEIDREDSHDPEV